MEWKDLPREIQEKMLERQLEQTGKKEPDVFSKRLDAGKRSGGFNWDETIEDEYFWDDIIRHENFDIFYMIYPKSPIKFEYHREFKRMFRVNKIPNHLSKEILKVLEEKNLHKEWIKE